MTGEQKQQIYLLRKKGATFGDIANKLNVPKNTVKTFCWRNGLSDTELKKPQNNRGYMGFCKQCGKPLEQKAKSRPKKFCCEKCRLTWWSENSAQINRSSQKKYICEYCGKEFLQYPSQNRRFCSHTCYIASRYYSEVQNGHSE